MKAKSIFIFVSLFVLLLVVAAVFYIIESPQSILPSSCSIEEIGTTSGSFECGNEYSLCEVKLNFYCDTKVSEPLVVFRGSSQQSLPTEIAVDIDGDGDLEPFARGTSYSTCIKNNIITFLPEPYQTNYVYLYSTSLLSKLYICTSDIDRGYNYISGGTISTSPNPLAGEACDGSSGFIRCSGSDSFYQCSQDVTGDVKKTIVYSSNSAGTKTETLTLSPGDKIYWQGEIKYTNKKTIQSECTKNIAGSDPHTYYVCKMDSNGCGELSSTPNACVPVSYVFDEDQQKCVEPFTVNVDIENTVISKSGEFNIDFKLSDTTDNKNIDVKVEILKNSQVYSTKTQKTGGSVLNAGETSFTLPAPPIGFYKIRISFTNIQGSYEEDFDVQVVGGINVYMDAVSTVQFDNVPVEVMIKSDVSGVSKDLKDFEAKALFNGVSVTPSVVEHPSLGILKLKYDVSGDGILRVSARGQDENSYWTEFTNPIEITVKKSTIAFTTNFKTDVCAGSITQSFETKDSTGNYVDTSNIVTINKPLGGSDTPPVTGKDGKYSFTYNYVDGGLYIIRIDSTSSELGNSQLNGGQGQQVSILVGQGCSSSIGGTTSGGSNALLYVILGVMVLVIGLVVFFVFKKK